MGDGLTLTCWYLPRTKHGSVSKVQTWGPLFPPRQPGRRRPSWRLGVLGPCRGHTMAGGGVTGSLGLKTQTCVLQAALSDRLDGERRASREVRVVFQQHSLQPTGPWSIHGGTRPHRSLCAEALFPPPSFLLLLSQPVKWAEVPPLYSFLAALTPEAANCKSAVSQTHGTLHTSRAGAGQVTQKDSVHGAPGGSVS